MILKATWYQGHIYIYIVYIVCKADLWIFFYLKRLCYGLWLYIPHAQGSAGSKYPVTNSLSFSGKETRLDELYRRPVEFDRPWTCFNFFISSAVAVLSLMLSTLLATLRSTWTTLGKLFASEQLVLIVSLGTFVSLMISATFAALVVDVAVDTSGAETNVVVGIVVVLSVVSVVSISLAITICTSNDDVHRSFDCGVSTSFGLLLALITAVSSTTLIIYPKPSKTSYDVT